MTIIECFALMGVVALVGVGAIAIHLLIEYILEQRRIRKYKFEKVCAECESCKNMDWFRNRADCTRFAITVIPSVTSCNKWRKRNETD